MTNSLGSRADQRLVDLSVRTGYSLVWAKASDIYQFDWENTVTPAESSLIAYSWVCEGFAVDCVHEELSFVFRPNY